MVGSIVFMVFYIPLRLFCGGLHMPNRELCLLTSFLIYILMFGLAAIEVYEALLYKTLVTASIPIIALLAPVETRNKPILLDEAKRNKKISLLLLSAALFGLSILHALRLDILFYFASFSLILLSVLMLLGAVINRRHTCVCQTKM